MNRTPDPTSPSKRDTRLLSAYLDGQLSASQRLRLEQRLKTESSLADLLADLRRTRAMLRRLPSRRAPRNFTLTARMAGFRPPQARLVPVLSWASAVAALLFIFSLGASLLGNLSLGASAPMQAAAPNLAYGAGAPAATEPPAFAAPVLFAPVTQLPASDATAMETATPEVSVMSTMNEATAEPVLRQAHPGVAGKTAQPFFSHWQFVWLALALLLAVAAVLLSWRNRSLFNRKNPPD